MIAILGTGKMGEALLSGLLRAGRPPSAVVAAVRREDRGAELHARYGVQAIDAASAAKMADTLVLAVKPQDMGRLLDEIAPVVPPGKLVISVAAGITTAVILVVAAVSPQHAWQQPILRLVDTVVGVAVGAMAAWTGIWVVRLLPARSVPPDPAKVKVDLPERAVVRRPRPGRPHLKRR